MQFKDISLQNVVYNHKLWDAMLQAGHFAMNSSDAFSSIII